MPSLSAGKLRHRVLLQQRVPTQDELGQAVTSWVTRDRVWAAIEPMSAREFMQSAALQSEISTRITIRTRGDIAANWRVVHKTIVRGTMFYNVHGVLSDKESGLEYQTLPCSTGVNQG